MAPAPEPTAAAAGRKRKKPHGPSKIIAKKSADPKRAYAKKKKEKHKQKEKKSRLKPAEPDQIAATIGDGVAGATVLLSALMQPSRQLEFLLRSFERASKMRLSPLELDSYSEGCMVQLAEGAAQDVESFGDHVKGVFGSSWKEELCEGNHIDGEIAVGSPTLLVISSSALRSLDLLRGLKMFTKECRPVKLFAKHLKVEEQVAMLNARVNIACGTPSRQAILTIPILSYLSFLLCLVHINWAYLDCGTKTIFVSFSKVQNGGSWIKKLIDMEALSLSRLKLVVLDMQKDAKSFTLFTLPQVSNEFWDLYKGYLDPKIREGNMKICFYGAVSERDITKTFSLAE
ncbi:DEAD-box helicase family protein [Zea mays]|uniref:DEAD-box helicase family protein n=1 Tax=Zea mays TaxID=4577 RepID=A0A1D6EDD8_MAIZE|nr:DEAD-box helicase family protein [Zea mays]